jgi:hypothetical protein
MHCGCQLCAWPHGLSHEACKGLKAHLLNEPDEARLLAVTTGAVVPTGKGVAAWGG